MTFSNPADHLKMPGKTIYVLDEGKIHRLKVIEVHTKTAEQGSTVKYTAQTDANRLVSIDPERCFASIKDLTDNLEADFAIRHVSDN